MEIEANIQIEKSTSDGPLECIELDPDSQISESFRVAAVSNKKDCNRCNGLGKVPIFLIDTITERCDKCEGGGWKIVPCKKCQGGFNSKGKVCEVCNGTSKFILRPTFKKEKKGVPCKKCNGTGNINYKMKTKQITKFEECTHCKGKGKIKVHFGNPVISHSIANKLRSIM